MRSARRMLELAGVLSRHALAISIGSRLRRWPGFERLPPADLPEPERLRSILEELGGSFIKLGQMLALQPDILPLEYCDALFDLLDRVPPVPFEDVARVVEEELGGPPEEVFESFDPQPLASASVGQVHTARYRGVDVAIKVQRPTVERDFAGDIRLMLGAMRWIRRLRLRSLFWMLEPLDEFVAWTREELDYRREARYMERLRRNGDGVETQRVPEVFAAVSTRRVLTVEFLRGTTVLDHLRALDGGDEVTQQRLVRFDFDPDRFAGNIVDNFLTQVFTHGLFHADLHPANLMILPDNVVGYLDFGITGALSPFSRRHLVAMTLAHTRGDIESMQTAMLAVSVADPGADVAEFRNGMRRLAKEWYERDDAGGGVRLRKNFTLVMLDMLKLSRATGVWPERDVIKYIRSSMAIDGLITRLAPGIDLARYLQEVCTRHLEQRAWAENLSSRHLLDWSAASARLMLNGGVRIATMLDRWGAQATAAPRRDSGRDDEDAPLRSALVAPAMLMAIATVVVAVAWLAAPDVRPELGFNRLTALTFLIAAGTARLVAAARVPASTRPRSAGRF